MDDAATPPTHDQVTRLCWAQLRMGPWLVGVLEGGRGVPVVFLHGSGDTAFVWKPVLSRFASEHRVCAVDFGESRPVERPIEKGRLDADQDLLNGVLAAIGEPVHLAGHSYGALLALRFALEHPGRLRSLCLTEPIAFGLLRDARGRHRPGGKVLSVLEAFFDEWRLGATASAVALIVDYWNGAGAWAAMADPHKERIRAGAERFREEVVCAYEDTTSAEEASTITLPTLIVRGADTTDESRAVCGILTRTIPGARGLSVAGARHSPMRSHPGRFAAALLDLIASTGQASRG